MPRGSGIGDNATSPAAPAVRDRPPSPPMNLFAPVVAYPALACAVLLTLSNLFMTFAWYGHLKHLQRQPVVDRRDDLLGDRAVRVPAAGPANRIGYTALSLAQLKILQEIITLTVFVPFAMMYMDQPLKLDYLWAGPVPAGRRLLHLPRLTTALVATPNDDPSGHALPADVFRVRGGLPAVVPLSHGQRRHLAGADPRARADAGVARPPDERLLRRVRGGAASRRHAARPLRSAARRAGAAGRCRRRARCCSRSRTACRGSSRRAP